MKFINNKIISTFLLFIVLDTIQLKTAFAQIVATIRLAEVISSHYMIQNFDLSTRRFKIGRSRFINPDDVNKEIQKLQATINQLDNQLSQVKNEYEKALINNNKNIKLIENRFWQTKKSIESQKEAIFDKIAELTSSIEFGGKTFPSTLLPDIQKIIYDVNTAINSIVNEKNITLLFNEPFITIYPNEILTEKYFNNYRKYFLETNEMERVNFLKNWLKGRENLCFTLHLHENIKTFYKPMFNILDITDLVIKKLQTLTRR